MGEVDPAFVQASEHRPKLGKTEDEEIPLIDLSPLFTNSSDDPSALEGLVTEIGNACKKWGFFQVINHGVPIEKRQKIDEASKEFFAQSLEEKRKIRRNDVNVFGYFDTEYTENVRDWREVFDISLDDPIVLPDSYDPEDEVVTKWHNQWPEYPLHLREICEEYAKEMKKLAYKLLELIALSLGLPADRFHNFFKDQTSRVKVNHYPACPAPDLALGVGRHKDGGALTILAQDNVGGLEVKRKSDGEWIFVKSIPDAYVINVGEIMQVWSNDTYESVEHRARLNSEKERFSMPFFFNPAYYTKVEPLEELINDQNPPKYKPYIWGKFLVSRKRSSFKKLGVDDIQISHFRIV